MVFVLVVVEAAALLAEAVGLVVTLRFEDEAWLQENLAVRN